MRRQLDQITTVDGDYFVEGGNGRRAIGQVGVGEVLLRCDSDNRRRATGQVGVGEVDLRCDSGNRR